MILHNNLKPWQQNDWLSLTRYIRQNRIPQALLLSGSHQSERYHLAKEFAYSLLCNHRHNDGMYCNRCKSCRLVHADTHPDFIELQPREDKSAITVEQIRAIINQTYLKPQLESYRVILINPADSLTLSAANAFLKCLEEPPALTVFILLTASRTQLPATILSRCQTLEIKFPDRLMLGDWLSRQGIDHHHQETLINLLKISALSLDQLSDNSLLKKRSECFNDWSAIAQGNSYPAIVSEKWKEMPEVVLLNWLLSWVTDLIKYKSTRSTKWLCNLDCVEALTKLTEKNDLKKLFGLYSTVLRTRQEIHSTLNFQLSLEEILVQWAGINRRHE